MFLRYFEIRPVLGRILTMFRLNLIIKGSNWVKVLLSILGPAEEVDSTLPRSDSYWNCHLQLSANYESCIGIKVLGRYVPNTVLMGSCSECASPLGVKFAPPTPWLKGWLPRPTIHSDMGATSSYHPMAEQKAQASRYRDIHTQCDKAFDFSSLDLSYSSYQTQYLHPVAA